MEHLKRLLVEDFELKARIGPEGLYLIDEDITIIMTEWKADKFWSGIGASIRDNQEETGGVYLSSVIEGTPEVCTFPGIANLDGKIRDTFEEHEGNLLDQYESAAVLVKCTAEGDFVVFNNKGQDVCIDTRNIDLLSELGVRLMPSEEETDYISFLDDSGTLGFIANKDVYTEPDEGSSESLEECVTILDEFDDGYARARRRLDFRRNDEVIKEVKQDFIETLYRISGYEKHGDNQLNRRVDAMTAELFPIVRLRRGVSFPIKGREYFETVSHERISHLEVDTDKWTVFVSDWDRGYSDTLGTYFPITSNIASFLRKEMPTLKVRKS